MNLYSLDIKNFRGATARYDLSNTGPLMICGENGSGKTRILQALQLALTGRVPHPIEDRSIELGELLTKRHGIGEMNVEVELADVNDETLTGHNHSITRSFTLSEKNGKESISQSIVVDGQRYGAIEGERAIKNLIGDLSIIDLSKFIRMSDDKRAEMIFKMGAKSDIAADDLLSKFDEYTAGIIRKSFQSSQNLEDGIIGAITQLKELLKSSKREKRDNVGASHVTLESIEVTLKAKRAAEQIKGDMETLDKEIKDATERLAEGKAQKRTYDERISKKELLTRNLADLQNPDKKPNPAPIRKEIAVQRTDQAQYEKEVMEIATAPLLDLNSLQKQVADVQAHIGLLKGKSEALDGVLCPNCGLPISAVVEQYASDIQHGEERVLELNAQIDAERTRQEAMRKRQTALNAKIKELNGIINLNEKTAMALAQREASYEQSIAELQRQIAELDQKPQSNLPPVAIMEQMLVGLHQRKDLLQKEYNERVQYDAQILLLKKAAMEAANAEARVKSINTAIDVLKTFRHDLIQRSIEPIRETAQQIFSKFMDDNQTYRFDFRFQDSRGNEAFRFGWVFDTVLSELFVDFDSLSTSQQLATLVALMTPLIKRSGDKFFVLLLDNCEVVDRDSRPRFCALLGEAHKSLDNLIVASSDSEFPLFALKLGSAA